MRPTGVARDARRIVVEAREVARLLDAPAVEAEHLLLAAARVPGTPAHAALAGSGLGYDELVEALEAEFEASLAAVGVTLSSFSLPSVQPDARTPRWGTSARAALQRAGRIAGGRRDRRVDARHLLLGIVRARAGTAPRALRLAGVDPLELAGRVEASSS